MRKWLVCATVALFVGTSLVSASQSTNNNNKVIEYPMELLLRGHIAFAFGVAGNYNGLIEFELDDPGNLTIGN
jgi:hypothetical protein